MAVPSIPTDLIVTPGSTEITLSWDCFPNDPFNNLDNWDRIYKKEGTEVVSISSGKINFDLPDSADTELKLTYDFDFPSGNKVLEIDLSDYTPDIQADGFKAHFNIRSSDGIDIMDIYFRTRTASPIYIVAGYSILDSVVDYFDSDYINNAPTKFRIAQSGTVLTVSYYDSEWIVLGSKDFNTRAVNLIAVIIKTVATSNRGGSVNYDNLICTNFNADSYNIYWRNIPGVTKENGTKITDVTSIYEHTSLDPNKTYYYVITAINSYGESDESTEYSGSPIPAAPTGVVAVAGIEKNTLAFNPATGADSYNAYWKNSSGVTKEDTKITGITSPHQHTDLTPELPYYYIITSLDTPVLDESDAWTQVAPQLGDETGIRSLVVFSNKLYGGTLPNGKLYEWNETDAWVEKAGQLSSQTYVDSLIEFNSKLYGGTYPNGQLFEWNGTDTWVEKAPQLNGQIHIRALAECNGKLYGGTSSGGRLFEWNGTDAWVEKAPKLGVQTHIHSLIEFNNKIYGGTGPNGKLYEWNGADAWTIVAGQLNGQTEIRSLVECDGKLYGGTGDDGRLFEWNGTDAWVQVASQLGDEITIYTLVSCGGRLFGGTSPNGKLYEWNGTDAWVEKAAQLNGQVRIFAIMCNGVIHASTTEGGRLFEWHSYYTSDESVISSEVSGIPLFDIPPAPGNPLVVILESGDSENVITCSDSVGAVSYNLYWSTDPNLTTENGTKIEGITRPYSHEKLTKGKYYYIITAVNAQGEGEASSIIEGKIDFDRKEFEHITVMLRRILQQYKG